MNFTELRTSLRLSRPSCSPIAHLEHSLISVPFQKVEALVLRGWLDSTELFQELRVLDMPSEWDLFLLESSH